MQEIITDISSLFILPFICSLRFKLRVLPRGILSPSYKTGVDSKLSVPLSYRQSDMPINYKSHYNLRLDSSFASKLAIRSSSKFVFDEVFTESLLVNLFKSLTPKVIIQPIRDYILPLIIIFSKWILKFRYISPLNSYYVYFFVAYKFTIL